MSASVSTLKSSTNDVLFQKLGNTWFAFCEINGETVYSALPQNVDPRSTNLELYHLIEDHLKKVSELQKRRNATTAA